MAKILFLIIIIAALIAVQAEDQGPPPEPPAPPKPAPPKPDPPITTTTTSTTAHTPTTLPTKPTSTTKKTEPTTKTPPSPAPPTPPPTPKPQPPPEPPKPVDPPQGTWNYTDKSNVTCIKIQFALQIVIPYFHMARNKTYNATVNVPTNALVADGACGNGTEHLKIQWMNKENATDGILFKFESNDTSKEYELNSIEINIYPDSEAFPGIENKSVITLKHNHWEFVTALANSYKCEREQKLNLTDDFGKEKGVAAVSHLQVQAFGTTNSTAFKSAIDCDSSSTPDVVPIAVGCALAILVIVVLVAYLIGRKRRQARGYLSM